MSERRIGLRELKSKLSECVRERLEALESAGVIQWSGRRLIRRKLWEAARRAGFQPWPEKPPQ